MNSTSENNYACRWVVGGLFVLIMLIAYFNAGERVTKQYSVLEELCERLSFNLRNIDFYSQCMVTAQDVYDDNNQHPSDD